MKKYILILLVFMLFISGCSESYDSQNQIGAVMSAERGEVSLDAEMLYNRGNVESLMEYADYDMNEAEDSVNNFVNTSTASAPIQRKIVKNANINMEAADVEQAYDNIIERLVEWYDGYEANKSLETYRHSGDVYIHAELKIPAENLDSFMRDIKNQGDIITQNVYSSDITDQYYDSRTRLETLEKTLAKYYEFLDDAKTVREQLEISNYISDLTYQIESLKGSLSKWDFIVQYSSVSLYITKIYEYVEPPRVIEWSSLSLDDMGYLIKSGFINTSSFIVNGFQRLLIWLIAGSPVLIPAAVIIFFIIRREIKKRRAGKREQQEQSEG